MDVAGGVTVGVTSCWGCHRRCDIPGRPCWGCHRRRDSLADAGVASLADLAGGVTIGVASPAVAAVASLADAGVASLVDLAGGVTIRVASPAVAGWGPWPMMGGFV